MRVRVIARHRRYRRAAATGAGRRPSQGRAGLELRQRLPPPAGPVVSRCHHRDRGALYWHCDSGSLSRDDQLELELQGSHGPVTVTRNVESESVCF